MATTLTNTFPSSVLVLLPRPGDIRRPRAGTRVRGARRGSARSRLRDIALLVSTFGMLAGLLLSAAPAQAAGPPLTTITTGQTPLVLGYLPLTPDGAGGTPCDVKTLEGCEHAATIVAAINATPCTGRITATFYSFSIDAYADALVAREKCGTDLHILTWHGVDEDGKVIMDSDPLRRVQAAVKKYGNGWYKSCRYSCYDTRAEGTMHMKEWLFSSTGGQSNVIISSENNATYNADFVHFGSLTVLSDKCAYKALAAWVDRGRADKKQSRIKPFSTCDGRQTFHVAPTKKNAALDLLKAIKKPAPGCRVEHDMNQVTIDGPTTEVVRLQNAGCQTHAVVNWKLFSSGALKSASQMKQIRRLVAGGVPTFDASWSPTVYNHRKQTIAENGDTRWLASGATNQTTGSFKSANILLVSRVDADVTTAFTAADAMVAYSHLLTLNSVGCVGATKKQPAGCVADSAREESFETDRLSPSSRTNEISDEAIAT